MDKRISFDELRNKLALTDTSLTGVEEKLKMYDDCHCTETLEALDITIAERDECYKQIAKLEKALNFYAEPTEELMDEYGVNHPDFYDECGFADVAKEALKED
jgi:hypothetical protein